MSAPVEPGLSVRLRVDEVCDRFEAAWRSGSRPRVADYLIGTPPAELPALVAALIAIDVELRLAGGDRPTPEDYTALPGADPTSIARLLSGREEDTHDRTVDHTPAPDPDDSVAEEGGGRLADAIPGYELLGEIARGGMGVVYAARDVALNREVAVKTVLAASAEVRARFVREAHVAGQLEHPAIPPVHHLGTLPDGRPFLAMKLIRGRTLAADIAARPEPAADLPRFVQAFEQICQAVGFAHAQGIVHRDLKPLNVMVGAFGEVQVMDWGLAREMKKVKGKRQNEDEDGLAATRSGALDSEATQAGQILGTPTYMAPEQARGEDVDARADVFALGGILCVILTGHTPNTGATAAEVIARAAAGNLTAAFTRLDGCNADPGLVALAKHCLSPDRNARPADGKAVADAVAAHRSEVDTRLRKAEAERAAAEARTAEQRRKRRWQLALVGSVAVAAGLAGLAVWLQARAEVERETGKARQAAAEAETREAELRRSAAQLGAAVASALEANDFRRVVEVVDAADRAGLSVSPEQRFAAATALAALSEADAAQSRLRKLLASDITPDLRAAVELRLGDLLLGLDDVEAIELIGTAAASGRLAPADRFYAEAIRTDDATRAIDRLRAALREDVRHLPARRQLGMMLFVTGRLDEAAAVAESTRLLARDHPDVLWTLFVANAYRGDRKATNEAFALLRQHIPDELAESVALTARYAPLLSAEFAASMSGRPPVVDLTKNDLLLIGGPRALAKPLRQTSLSAINPLAHVGPAFRDGLADIWACGLAAALGQNYLVDLGDDEVRLAEMKRRLDRRPEGFMRYIYACALLCRADRYNARYGKTGPHAERFRDLLVQTADAYLAAADIPGLINCRAYATEAAAFCYSRAAAPWPGMPQIPGYVQKCRELTHRRLDMPEPMSADMYTNLASAAAFAADWVTARRVLERWERQEPDDPAVAVLRAKIEYRAGAYSAALEAVRKVLAVDSASDWMRGIEAQSLDGMRRLAATVRPHAPPPRPVGP